MMLIYMACKTCFIYIEDTSQGYRICPPRYRIYIIRLSNIYHKMIEKIHHNIIQYTSQGFEHESQDL